MKSEISLMHSKAPDGAIWVMRDYDGEVKFCGSEVKPTLSPMGIWMRRMELGFDRISRIKGKPRIERIKKIEIEEF